MKLLYTIALIFIPLLSLSQFIQVGNDIYGDGGDASGISFDLNFGGDYVVVGQAFNSSAQGTLAGRVRVYRDVGGIWTQVGQDLLGDLPYDTFGYEVSISDDGLTIAVLDYSDINGSNSGSVRIFYYNGTSWVQVGQSILGDVAFDAVSADISLSGDGRFIIIGSPSNGETGIVGTGKVRVFENLGGTWTQKGSSIFGSIYLDDLGSSVDISGGNYIAIGVPGPQNVASPAGKVLLYFFNGLDWVLTTTILGTQPVERFGQSVAISEDAAFVIVGAPRYDSNNVINVGQVRVYSSLGIQVGQSIEPVSAAIGGSNFGDRHTVGISQAGDVIVVGERYNQLMDTDGIVRAFKLVQNQWVQISQDLTEVGDEAYYVAISGDGNRIGQSSELNDQNGANSGLTKIFELCVDIGLTLTGNSISSNQTNSTYQWIDCDNGNAPISGATNQTFTPSQSGSYAVIVSANGCMATSECIDFILVGVDELDAFSLWLYPNPSNTGVVTLNYDSLEELNVEVTDALGRVVFAQQDVENNFQLTLNKGNYFVSVSSEAAIVTKKVIVH